MSDGSLSQDEIDALLQGSDDLGLDSGIGDSNTGFDSGSSSSPLSQAEISSFKSLLNASANNQGQALGAMVGKNVNLSNPKIEIIKIADLQKQLPDTVVEVKMDYDVGITGEHNYVLDIETAKIISNLMMGQEGGDLTDASLSAISEAMNTIAGNASTTIGNQIKKEFRCSPPIVNRINKNNLSLNPGGSFVKVVYDFSIDNRNANLVEVFGLNIVKELTSSVLPISNEMSGSLNSQQGLGQQKSNMMGQGFQGIKMTQKNPQVQQVQFASFNEGMTNNQGGNINLLMDVTMDLTVELGRTKATIKSILGMGEGTVLELDKLAGEPVDILVNGKLIARGEVVVIDENFGVRITEIISPQERMQELA